MKRGTDCEAANMEDVMVFAPPNMTRKRTWRMLPLKSDQKDYDFGTLVFQDRWTLSRQQVESTGLFGEDYAELANIAQQYQVLLPSPVRLRTLVHSALCGSDREFWLT